MHFFLVWHYKLHASIFMLHCFWLGSSRHSPPNLNLIVDDISNKLIPLCIHFPLQIVYAGIIASTSSILVLCLLLFSCLLGCKRYRSRKKSKETPRIESFLQKHAAIHSKRYTYSQVKRMTRNFAEKLGQGGFGVVYRGDLSGGRQIAVKMLKDSKAEIGRAHV